LVQSGETRFRWTIWARTFMFALLGLAVLAVAPARSAAFVSGQQEAWGIHWGTGTGEVDTPELHNPIEIASDPNDGSVYVGDLSGNNLAFRVQKFSQNGNPLGVTETIPANPGGIVGIGLNPASGGAGRFYVLLTTKQTTEPQNGKFVAEKIREYSTTPNGSGQLEKLEDFTLPAAGSGEALVSPRQIGVDPTTGQLVVLALNEAGQIVVQRMNGQTGAFTSRYTETGTTITGGASVTTLVYGMGVAKSGTTYLVTAAGSVAQSGIRAYTLAPELSTATPTAVPGFEAAAITESGSGGQAGGGGLIVEPPAGSKFAKGPQVAVATAEDGSDTIFYKTLSKEALGSNPGKYFVHGYSVAEEATSTIYGNGVSETTSGECTIQTKGAGLVPGKEGTLEVLDQGQLTASESALPTYGPNLFRFGPDAGTSCHVPAAALELKVGGSKTASVPAGATVTLDGSASELNGQTLAETFWTIKGPVESTASIAGPATSTTKQFDTPGTYTLREKIQTSAPTGLGTTVTAQPQTLVVTGAPSTPTVTSVSPNHGTTAGGETITVHGTNLGTPTGVGFGGTAGTEVTGVSATELTVKSPPHAAGQVDVIVTAAAGTSPTGSADQFTFETSAPPAPACTAFTPNHGSTLGGAAVTLTGTNLGSATKVEFGTASVTTFTEDTATTIKLNSPAHAAGPVPIKITTAGGTATCAGGEFTFEAPGPAVTSVSPNHGTAAGGETITIEGTSLSGVSGVSFGGVAASEIREVSATKLTVKSSAHAAGQVDVIVAATAGTTTAGAADKFTYESPVVVPQKLTIGTAGSGSGSVKCNGGGCAESYAPGTAVTLEAVPASGSTFAGWSGGNCSGTGSCKVTITGPVTVTATFNPTPSNNPTTNTQPSNSPRTNTPKPPSNSVTPGAIKLSGTSASMTLIVPGPGTIVVSGKGVVGAKYHAKGAGPVQLKLALTSAEKKQLAKKGKVTVKVKIVYTPTGGSPGVMTKTITFKTKKSVGKRVARVLTRLLASGF
jgi:IPT/TIG domain/Divergent InlB B-repeat domain